MAGTTSVSVEGMTAAQANFQDALDQCNTAYNDMTEQQQTLAANWTGEASSAFGNALESWLEDLGVVRTQLTNILEQLSANTGVYANTNETSTSMASMFGQKLTGLPGF